MEKDKKYIPRAGETLVERQRAELEDDFARSAALAAQSGKLWEQFLSEHWMFKNVATINNSKNRARYEQLRLRVVDSMRRGSPEKIDPEYEVQRVRQARHKRYEEQNKELRYAEMKDSFLRYAFKNLPWSAVEREMKEDLSPWDPELYERARKECGFDTPETAPDTVDEHFAEGFVQG